LCITVGLLVAAVVVNATKDLDNAGSFAIPIGIQFIWGTILVIGLVFLPESPRWLVLRGRVDDAVAALSRLMGSGKDSTEVRELYEVIAANLEHARATAGGRWSDCFRGGESKTRRRILTGMGIQALQQLSVSEERNRGLVPNGTGLMLMLGKGYQLYLLLRHILLHQLGDLEPVPHYHCDQRRQHGHDRRRNDRD
jgi:hypothetical protein